VKIEHGVLRIWNRHRRLLTKVNRGTNHLYVLCVQVAQPVCLAARRDDDAWQWHERFGHLNFEALKQLSNKEMVQGMSRVEHVDQFCDTCVLTKQRWLPFPHQASLTLGIWLTETNRFGSSVFDTNSVLYKQEPISSSQILELSKISFG
jgi:hypothetical protein